LFSCSKPNGKILCIPVVYTTIFCSGRNDSVGTTVMFVIQFSRFQKFVYLNSRVLSGDILTLISFFLTGIEKSIEISPVVSIISELEDVNTLISGLAKRN